jgi:hypothetical protein
MLRKIVLRSSEHFVVVGPFERLSRIDATNSIKGVATVLLHGGFCSIRAARPMSQREGCSGIPQMGERS